MRFTARPSSVLVALVLVGASACAVVPTRLPAPLPNRGRAVGAFVGGATGQEFDTDYQVPYGLAFGGATIAWQALDLGPFAIELDGAAGGGVLDNRNPLLELYVGGAAGTRLWRREDTWAVGVDLNATGMLEVARPPRSGLSQQMLQLEARGLGALQLNEDTWLGTRPGLIFQLSRKDDSRIPLFDLPVALVLTSESFRFGIEVGVLGPVLPFPISASIHAGASGSFVF